MVPTSDRLTLSTRDANAPKAAEGLLARVCPCRHTSSHACMPVRLFTRPVTNPRVEDAVQNVYHEIRAHHRNGHD
jgi:hypothetical protein